MTPGQSGTGSDGNKGVFRIRQSSCITVASPTYFSVIPRILSAGDLPLGKEAIGVFCNPNQPGQEDKEVNTFLNGLSPKVKVNVNMKKEIA